MTSHILLKDFENENRFNLLLDEMEKSLNVDDKSVSNLPNSEEFSFLFDILIDDKVYKVQFLKFTKIINKYTYKILFDFTPTMTNINHIKKYRTIYTPHYNMSYFDGNYIHIYATTYMESIDLLLLLLTGTHHFQGFVDVDAIEYIKKFNKITYDKNIFLNPTKFIINKLYEK